MKRASTILPALAGVVLAGGALRAQSVVWAPPPCLVDTLAAIATLPDTTASSTVAPGITYRCVRRHDGPWVIHVVSIDLAGRRFRIEGARALDRFTGRERVSGMAARHAALGDTALVAINADFFDLTTGEVENNAVVDGTWVKGVRSTDSPHDEFDNAHTQFAIDGQGRPHIGRLQLKGAVVAAGATQPLVAINYRPPRLPGLVLYTPWYGSRTLVDSAATDTAARVLDPDAVRDTARQRPARPTVPQLRADTAHREQLAATHDALELGLEAAGRRGDTLLYRPRGAPRPGGGSDIPPSGAVLSATGDARDFVEQLARTGGEVRIVARLEGPEEFTPVTAVGGWPRLLLHGRNVGASSDSLEGTFPAFAARRHPRSAIALSRDSTTLMLVVVDGRRTWSAGMTLSEFADVLRSLGAWEAMNLDGGGSSTLWVHGAMVNRPSDPAGERAVGNAILVTIGRHR